MSRRPLYPLWFAAAGLAVLLGAGCVTETLNAPEDALRETKLVVTRAGEDVTLSWQAMPGTVYRVVYTSDSLSGQWQALPGAEAIRGTGGQTVVRDTVPVGRQRYYRLQVMGQAFQSP